MTQSSSKRDTKSKTHPGMKLALVRIFSCKHPLKFQLYTCILKTSSYDLHSSFWYSFTLYAP